MFGYAREIHFCTRLFSKTGVKKASRYFKASSGGNTFLAKTTIQVKQRELCVHKQHTFPLCSAEEKKWRATPCSPQRKFIEVGIVASPDLQPS